MRRREFLEEGILERSLPPPLGERERQEREVRVTPTPGILCKHVPNSKCSASQSATSILNSRFKQGKRPSWVHASPSSPWVRPELSRSPLKDTRKVQDSRQESQGHIALFDLIKACGKQKDLRKGSSIHAAILEKGLLGANTKSGLGISLANALLTMYAKCGALAKAQELFDELPARSVVTWNALISAYAQYGLGDEAWSSFQRMQDEGHSPNVSTYICLMKACSSVGAAEKGEEIHAELDRQGLLEKDYVLGTALVDMYAKCGALAKAQASFDKLPTRNIATWNALISAYVEQGFGYEAISCFERMQDEGLSPDPITFVCLLQACGSIGAAERGEEIHAEVDRQRLLERNKLVGTALVDMYAKCGELAKAQEVFDELPVRDVVTWTALIAGYTDHGHGEEALSSFERMQRKGLLPNSVTYISVLKACSSIGALEKGEEIRFEVARWGLLENNIVLGTALVDMYVNCGEFSKAHEVCDKLPSKDVAMWTSLIAGYAQVAEVQTVFDLFMKMRREGVEPDMVTFGVLLTACSHAGLVEEGEKQFDIMSSIYSIIPSLEHRTCMVDLFGRAGQFEQATSVIEKVLPSDSLLLWSALMGACQKWVNVQLGRWVFEHAIQLDPTYISAYVCMSNIYAAAGMQEEAKEVEALRKKNRAWKVSDRCWWTDVHRRVHVFTLQEKRHPQIKQISAKVKAIGERLRLEGFSPRPDNAKLDDLKVNALCGHGERMAMACALINTPEGAPIRVTKNMRSCADCHLFTLLLSKIEKRAIQIFEASCIHMFTNGKCVCDNYNDEIVHAK